MATRKLAESTLNRFKRLLQEKEKQLQAVVAKHEAERSEVRMAETAAERSPDPDSADGGSMAFEFEKELSVDRNTRDILAQVRQAILAVEDGTYGQCRVCNRPIPVARLRVLPHTSLCVQCASRRR
ncbi:MAG: TraR/DksA C4-type zinc finger protein [bacterium]|nr:TraR/DksA C4-type zinc finger protein [bacterium]MDE0287220.1 TraR/DksA C4-type zinc finger protein [bacterium]MDE0439523.1 TraR/DksA C4-type zinc finger protein [bacterium]